MKHTPGPWRVDQHTVGRYKGVNIETALGDRIASAGHSPFSLEEKQANAVLAAAAPELLEAALACQNYLVNHGWTDVTGADALNLLNGAISKAGCKGCKK